MCGVIGIYGHPEAANLAYLGLHALQHRGQDNAGMAVWDGDEARIVKDKGLVVLTSCSHRGVINTVRQAMAAAGTEGGAPV